MKLYNGPTSPFGRKVAVLHRELGLAVDEVEINVSEAEFLDAINPLRQIPTLELPAGPAIFDSTVISLYFIELANRPDILPEESKWKVLTTCSLCDGLMEAVLQRRMETLRSEKERSAKVTEKLEKRIERAISSLAAGLEQFNGDQLRLDRIAAACALEYTSFRFGEQWKAQHPSLAAWCEAFASRPSFMETGPKL
ncbi:MAG TPA: glutathione S-transferase family protein [Methyloceanibacter sp.]|jgi:glutathione S-transferase|nr:glutathione S-transferase family protein [Methyloceanibacter sp.]